MDVSAPITNTNKTATNSEFQRRLQKHQLASFTEYRVLSFSIGATAIFALIFALNIYDLGEKTVSGFFLKTALIYTVSLIFQIALRLKIVSEILATQNLSRSTRICGVLLLPFVLAGNVFSFVAGCTMFLKEITIEYQICIYMMLTNVSIIIVSVLNLFKDSVSNTFWLGLFLLFVMLVVSLGITLLVSKHITQKTIYKRMIWLCIPLVIISFSGNVFAFALALVIYKRCTQENLEISIKWVDIMRRLFKNQMAVTGLFVVVFLIALSICSTLTFDEAMAIDNDYSALLVEPCIKYPFGTDDFGRCVFSRIVYGARISLIIGLAAISYPMLLGGILGALAGYYGGRLDNVIMRTLDIIYAIPGILLSMVIIASFGANMVTLVFALGVHSIASYARVTRASVLTMANAEFVEAAKACGANDRVVIFKHILLNSMAPIIVNATIGIGGVVLSTSALSYLGIGIPSHIPEWGNVLRAGSAYLETKPYLAIFPGLAIMTIVLAYNFLGDGLRDALDPKPEIGVFSMNRPLLEIKDLHVQYITDDNVVKAVNGLNLEIAQGESFGLVGETGAGKTTTALSVMQLLPQPVGIVTKGEVLFDGDNLLQKTQRQSTQVRGDGISMVFQDPMTALNPTMRVSHQMMEVIEAHRHVSRRDSANICVEMLERVGIKKDRFYDYPHQLSGGMKQRVVIAMALLCRPRLLIADEPTTALDVTIQAQILEIIRGLIQELRMSMLLITHDLGIVAETCDRIAVMYAGSIVESGAVLDVYSRPKHPYTKGLFDSIPKLNEESIRLKPIEELLLTLLIYHRGVCSILAANTVRKSVAPRCLLYETWSIP